MTSIPIELSKERAQRLKEMALKLGLSAEDLARVSVEDLLTEPDEQFQEIVQYMLKKNSELYKRLAA